MSTGLGGDVRIAVRVDAGEAVRALGQVERAQKGAAEATDAHARAAQKGGLELGRLGSTIGLLGGAVGRFSSDIGGLIGRIGQATGAVQSLSSMGFGPLGLAIGGVSIALQAGAAIWNEYESNVRNAARSVRDTAIPTFEQALDLIQRLDRETARRQRMEMGAGSEQEYRAQFDVAARRVAELQTQLRFLGGADAPSGVFVRDTQALDAERRRLLDQLRAARSDLDRARDALAQSMQIEAQIAADDAALAADEIRAGARERGAPRRGGGRQPREREVDPKDEARALAAEAEALRQKREEMMQALMEQGQADLDETLRLLAYENQERARALEERERMEEAARRRQMEKERETQEYLLRLREESAARLRGIAESIGSSFESALSSSLNAVLEGSKTADEAFQQMLRAFARQVVGEATIGALKETALGFAALATYRAAEATNHFTAAGLWAAAGVAAAGVGGAVGAFSAPSGAGASSGPPTAPRAEGRGGEQTIVVNFGGPVVTAGTEAELGRRLRDLVSTGAERLPR